MSTYDDIEIGCCVYSQTIQNSGGYVGGVVIAIDPIAETVETLGNFATSRGPTKRTIPFADLDMGVAMFDTKNAGAAANQLFTWLSRVTAPGGARAQRTNSGAGSWADVAAMLQHVRDAGLWTPRYDERQRS